MKRSRLWIIGLLTLVLGGAFLFFSMLFYSEQHVAVGMYGSAVVYPMRQHFLIPLVIGIPLLISGIILVWKSESQLH